MSLRLGNQIIPNVTVRLSSSGVTNYQVKTITPSTSVQNVVADSGFDALSKVTVNAIQTETKTVTTNGTVTPSSGKYLTSVTVNVPVGSTINNQNKTVTPTTSQQSITADSGYTGLGTVTVNRIPTNYLIPSGNKSITANGTNIDVAAYSTVSVNVSSTINNQNKTVTPTTSQQTINADSGYSGLGTVTVNAIQTETKTVTTNGTVIPSSGKYLTSVTVNVPTGSTINNQNKTVTPSTSQQSITADSGYTGLGTVTVNAMPTMTLPTSAATGATSGFTRKATITPSTSIQYINIPTGYNSAGAYYQISAMTNGSVTAPSSISGTTATVSTGTNTLTLTKTISVTPNVTTAGYISSGTAGNSSVSLTASVTTKAATTYRASTSAQTIAAGTYLTGAQTIAAVSQTNLSAANIKAGTTISVSNGSSNIWSVAGTFTSDATAVAADIANGKTAYVNGDKLTGTLSFINIYTGSNTPASSLGSNGDIYLQS